MGFLNYLGLDDLADSLKELTDGIDELKDEVIGSIVGPSHDLKDTVNDIASSIMGDDGSQSSSEVRDESAAPDTSATPTE